jgi:alpha-N-arabinofuranosidase
MILTDQDKLVLTPTYHVFHMYVPFQDATFLPVSFDAGSYVNGEIKVPKVDAIAAKGKDGKTWLALTNIDPASAAQFELTTGARRATGKILSGPQIDSVNSFDAPATVTPKPFQARASGNKIALKLPPHSVAVIALEE